MHILNCLIWRLEDDGAWNIGLTVAVAWVPNLAYSVKVVGRLSTTSHISIPPDTGPRPGFALRRMVVAVSTGRAGLWCPCAGCTDWSGWDTQGVTDAAGALQEPFEEGTPSGMAP